MDRPKQTRGTEVLITHMQTVAGDLMEDTEETGRLAGGDGRNVGLLLDHRLNHCEDFLI